MKKHDNAASGSDDITQQIEEAKTATKMEAEQRAAKMEAEQANKEADPEELKGDAGNPSGTPIEKHECIGACAPMREPVETIEERAQRKARNRCEPLGWRTGEVAMALLQNPQIHQFVAGNPIDGHKCEDGISVGRFLARRCYAIARDFGAELNDLIDKEMAALAANILAGESEAEANE